MDWNRALIPPEFCKHDPKPTQAWSTFTADNRPLEAIVWGEGSEARPFRMLIRIGVDRAHTEPAARHPTFEEVRDTVNHVLPEGTMMSLGFVTAETPGTEPKLPEACQWLGLTMAQVGVLHGSAAARSSLILTRQKPEAPDAN